MKKQYLYALAVLFFVVAMFGGYKVISVLEKSDESKTIDDSREYNSKVSITLDDDSSDDYEWLYNLKKSSYVSVEKGDNYKETTTFTITGLRKGKTKLSFTYADINDSKDVIETIEYSVKVRSDKSIKLTKESKEIDTSTINEKNIIASVLKSEKKFTNEDGQEITVNAFKMLEGSKIEVDKIAYVDLNKDDIKEAVIIPKAKTTTYFIFRINGSNQKVYGYEIKRTSLKNLKKDGSFTESMFSTDQVYYSGIKFDKNVYKLKEAAYAAADKNEYRIKGKEATKEDVAEYITNFNRKDNVIFE